jgi:hypothetical protein
MELVKCEMPINLLAESALQVCSRTRTFGDREKFYSVLLIPRPSFFRSENKSGFVDSTFDKFSMNFGIGIIKNKKKIIY